MAGAVLQLRIPELRSDKLLRLLEAAYQEHPKAYISALEVQPLYALAASAHLLQCSELLNLADASLASRNLQNPVIAVNIYAWACKHGTPLLQAQSAAYIADNFQQLDLPAQDEGFLVPLLLKLQAGQQQQQDDLVERVKRFNQQRSRANVSPYFFLKGDSTSQGLRF